MNIERGLVKTRVGYIAHAHHRMFLTMVIFHACGALMK